MNLTLKIDDENVVRSQMTTAILSDCDRCGQVEALHDDCDACFELADPDTSPLARCDHYTCRSCGMAL